MVDVGAGSQTAVPVGGCIGHIVVPVGGCIVCSRSYWVVGLVAVGHTAVPVGRTKWSGWWRTAVPVGRPTRHGRAGSPSGSY